MPDAQQPSPERMRKALRLLHGRLGDDPAVTLVDTGLDPSSPIAAANQVLRVHVSTPDAIDRLRRAGRLPSEIGGVSVIAVVGDYRLEAESSKRPDRRPAEGQGT
jgi:hypothetical protein